MHTHTRDPGSRRDIFSPKRGQASVRVSWGLGLRLPRASCVLGWAWSTACKRFHSRMPKIKLVLRSACVVSGWLRLGFLSDIIRLHNDTFMQLPNAMVTWVSFFLFGSPRIQNSARSVLSWFWPGVQKSQTRHFVQWRHYLWVVSKELASCHISGTQIFRKYAHPYSRLMPSSTLKQPTTALFNRPPPPTSPYPLIIH